MIEVVKGGLILDLGVRGFLPASLVDIRRVQDLDEFLGKELRCKVIELNRSRNNVVLSRRAVLEDERKEMRQAILDRLNPGDVVDGQISNIVDFGAFVDLDGMDGLIHISELSWSHVNHPSEVLEIGQTVKVKVLDIDRDRQRISLGLKQTQSDPWQQVLDSYSEGDVVEGRVTKVVTFGAFVEILPGVEGLVHISELAQHHVENPREVVSQGDAVNVLILEIDGERRRLSLSLKRVEEGAAAAAARRRRRVRAPDAEPGALRGGLPGARGRCPTSRADQAEAETSRPRPSEVRGGPTERRRCRATPRLGRRAGASREADGPARTPSSEAASRAVELEAPPSRADSRPPAARPTSPRRRRDRRAPRVAATARGRHHRRDRRRQERGAAGVPRARRGDRLERRDRPPPARDGRRTSRARWSTGSGRASSAPTAGSTAGASPRSSSATARSSPGSRSCCTRSSPREYLRWREQLAALPDAARGVRHRGAAALRGRRRDALRQGRRDHRAAPAARAAPARAAGRPRRAAAARREKAKRADFAYVNTGTLEELDAWVGGVMAELTARAAARPA